MSTRKETIEARRTGEPIVTRVVSHDGTEIGYWTSGHGPPLVLVHGAPADHTRFGPLFPYLEPHATVHAMDRRGRGASGDGRDYGLARELEDVAAVIEAVADTAGLPVDVYGHSFGGFAAFGAATLTSSIRRLVLYEGWPPVRPDAHALPPEVEKRLDALLAEGDREAVVETLFRELVGMTDDELAAMREQPSWQVRVAVAHTITREIRAIAEMTFAPELAAKISVPTLLLTGSESDDPSTGDAETVAEALPDARVVVLEGHGHVADILASELVAGHILAFLCDH
jgi:pimeloyl-ACP methyl ester carboxylesterase